MESIRPSSDLRNHYKEISRQCHESREPVYITVQGRGDTVVIGINEFKQMKDELELLRMLADAEDDVIHNRVSDIKSTFDEIRTNLLSRSK